MQMNTTDLAHRAADFGHAATSIATQVVDTITEHGGAALDTAGRVAGDVGDVIVDAVDRVGRAMPAVGRRRFRIAPLWALGAIVVAVVVVRRRRAARTELSVRHATDSARPVDAAAANGAPRVQPGKKTAEARAAGLA